MNSITGGIIGFLGGIITLATISVVLSKKSNTANVIKESVGGVSKLISAAVSPVSGGNFVN